jgi:hypothetical protein
MLAAFIHLHRLFMRNSSSDAWQMAGQETLGRLRALVENANLADSNDTKLNIHHSF